MYSPFKKQGPDSYVNIIFPAVCWERAPRAGALSLLRTPLDLVIWSQIFVDDTRFKLYYPLILWIRIYKWILSLEMRESMGFFSRGVHGMTVPLHPVYPIKLRCYNRFSPEHPFVLLRNGMVSSVVYRFPLNLGIRENSRETDKRTKKFAVDNLPPPVCRRQFAAKYLI
jgi:hypothetical protein